MVVVSRDANSMVMNFWDDKRIKEFKCAPNPQENKHHWNEDKLAVGFTNSCHQTRAKVVMLFTNFSL